ncbi:unnamed protein product [Nezara viridula]|uniref:Uncharacterized protein n=1 Tax=Nezara viridula TaxID=85310 RepID=A0A9P0MRE3_NEZVI|nr:unnamed protein product [Nezara viridula]
MFSDIPPALQHTFMDCCRNRENEPIGWGTNQSGECYANFFNVTQQSLQQSLSNWQVGDLSATQQRYVSDTLVISGCNPLIPNTVCLQNPHNPNMFHSYNVGQNNCLSTAPRKSLITKEQKEKKTTKSEKKEIKTNKSEEKEMEIKKNEEKENKTKSKVKKNEYCEELCKFHIDKAVQEICKAMQINPTINKQISNVEKNQSFRESERHIFPRSRSRKIHSVDHTQENGLPTEKYESKSSTDPNYKLLFEKIDIWAKVNCRMIRDLSKQISDSKCCQCQKHQDGSDKRMLTRDLESDDSKQSNCYQNEYVVCQYEEITNTMHTTAVEVKPKKSRFPFWKKFKLRIK